MNQENDNDLGLLKDWVYAESRLINSGDKTLLTEHARAQLSRALNAKKLIAVVGSGVSAAYGMPSWKQLLKGTAEGVVEYLGSLLEPAQSGELLEWIAKADNTELPPAVSSQITWPGLVEALRTFGDLGLPAKADDLAVDKLAVAFEATENLFALCRCQARSGESDSFSPRDVERQAHAELREQLKWRLKDDRGRIELLFAALLKGDAWKNHVSREGGQLVGSNNNDKKMESFCRTLNHLSYYMSAQNGLQSRGSDLFASAFSLAFYDIEYKLSKSNGKWGQLIARQLGTAQPQEIASIIKSRLQAGQKRDTPDKKFLVDAAFQLLAPATVAYIVAKLSCSVIKKYGISGFASDGPSQDVVPARLTYSAKAAKDIEIASRLARAAIPKIRDPIAIMAEDLGIKRFLTTNYDNQFDRYFASKGYDELNDRPPDQSLVEDSVIPTGSRSAMQDTIGNHAEFTAYEVGAAPFLFDFGADTRDSGHRIVHIHGRAAKRQSWLVLSERDYRERYARDDEPIARGDDAMRLVFTANPLLFVGLGMDEPDILRPLRAFTQDVGRLIDRPAVALLPQEASAEIKDMWHPKEIVKNRIADIEKLDRYGVYVLRYGEASSEQARGLAHFMAAADKQRILATDWLLPSDVSRSSRTTGWIHKLLSDLGRKLPPEEPSQAAARSVLLEGIQNAIRTHFFCEALIQCKVDWNEWLASWSATPMRREPLGDQLMGVTLGKPDARYTKNKKVVVSNAESARDWTTAVEHQSYYSASRHRILLRQSPGREEDALVKLAQEKVQDLGPESFSNASKTHKLERGKTELLEQFGPNTDRFFAGAPSPVFPLLQASLQHNYQFKVKHENDERTEERTVFPPVSNGSRVLFLLGSRGSGRGQMFNAMQSPRRFAQLCAWMGLIEPSNGTEGWLSVAREVHRGFFNLGLSHEVISVFDRLAYLLEQVLRGETRRLEPDELPSLEKRVEGARGNRIRRLRFALEELQALNERQARENKAVRRTVIVIDHLSVLFTVNGRPKNAQARRIYEALTDDIYKNGPVDFIFLISEDHAPYNLRCEGLRRNRPDLVNQIRVSTGTEERPPILPGYLQPVWLKPQHLPQDKEERDRRRLVNAQLWNSETLLKPRKDARVFVHLLESVRPATLAARFFPRLAAAMLAINHHSGSQEEKRSTPLLFFGTAEQYDELHKQQKFAVPPSYLINMGNINILQQSIVSTFETIFGGLESSIWNDPESAHDLATGLMDHGLDIMTLRFPATTVFQIKNPANVEASSISAEKIEDLSKLDIDEFKGGRSDQEFPAKLPELFRSILRSVGYNRYALTVVLAALDDMIARRIPGKPHGYVNPEPIRAFVEKLRLATNGRDPGTRADIVVDLVQDLYKSDNLNGLGQELPAWPFEKPDFESSIGVLGGQSFPEKVQGKVWKKLKRINNVLLQSLQEEILIVLAKIGQPVSVSAIGAVGSIAELLKRIINDQQISNTEDCPDHVAKILTLIWTCDLLVHRCLIFRVAPKGDEMELHGRINHRFATHKVLRRTIFARFNMPLIDFSDVDQLTVSLYATQPNDLPRPGGETHRRNRLLVDQLAAYQQKPGELVHGHGDAFSDLISGETVQEERKALERTRLRAAYGILRSIYSVGVVSRFSTHEGGNHPAPEHGYFESHRLRVRWLLRKAVELDGAWKRSDSEKSTEPLVGERTFHAEEIVWLFNECGVLSLAQGRLADAAALLRQARLAARNFLEGSEWGALHARIGLNLAVTSIERGRLQNAEDMLHQILNDRRETDPMHLIADGYLGEVDACRGMVTKACETFERAANGLAMIRRSRAAAIMMINHANLLRQSDPGNSLGKATQLATAACDLATQGGHEDIRQLGQLAHSWIEIAKTEGRATSGEKARIDRRLDAIADYAKVMSMPRLQCGVALARSAFFIAEGEFRMAAEIAQIALQSATRHDMEMKKVAALGLLGTAMLRQANRSPRSNRRAFNEAELLLRRARDLAYNMGFTAQVSKIEQVLTDYA